MCLWSDLGDVLLSPDAARVGAGHGGVEHDKGAGALPANILLVVVVLNDVTVMVLIVRRLVVDRVVLMIVMTMVMVTSVMGRCSRGLPRLSMFMIAQQLRRTPVGGSDVVGKAGGGWLLDTSGLMRHVGDARVQAT